MKQVEESSRKLKKVEKDTESCFLVEKRLEKVEESGRKNVRESQKKEEESRRKYKKYKKVKEIFKIV